MAKDSSRHTVPIIRSVSYEGLRVDFTNDGWFSATAAAKRFGKDVDDWVVLAGTLDYIRALDEVLTGKESRITDTRKNGYVKTSKARLDRGGGTWLHPKLAVRFAQWLDAKFAVWCDMQIDQILRERILAEDIRASEYLPTYHDLHHKIGLLAAGSCNKRFVHMNMNKLLNRTVGIAAGQRQQLDLARRSLMVVAQSVAISAMNEAADHRDGYRFADLALKKLAAHVNIVEIQPAPP